jgi:hypothetical protein
MTTKITVDAHAGWPVQVTRINADGTTSEDIVQPGETRDVYIHSTLDLRVHEVQPDDAEKLTAAFAAEPIMQFFAYSHLPPMLQAVSRPFGEMACRIVTTLPRNPERTVALRKLLEAKDAAVRARLAK